MGLYLPRRFAERQPTGVCGLRRNNPIAAGLVGLINGRRGIGTPRDLVVGGIVPNATGMAVSGDSVGYGQRVHGYNGALCTNRIGTIGQFAHWLPTSVASGFSLFACFDMLDFAAGTPAQIIGDAAGKWGFFNSSGGTGAWSAYISTAATNVVYSTAPHILRKGVRTVMGMTLSASTFSVYVNGVLAGSAAAVGGTSITYDPTYARVQFAGGFDQYGAANCFLWAGLWNRALLKEEARSLYEEKFQLLEPRPDRLWFPVTAPGAGYTGPTLFNPSYVITGADAVRPRVSLNWP